MRSTKGLNRFIQSHFYFRICFVVIISLWVGYSSFSFGRVPAAHAGQNALGQGGSIELPAPTQPIDEHGGWKLVYMAGAGLPARGSLKILNRVVGIHRIGVKLPSFHGMISGICEFAEAMEDKTVSCHILIWCEHENDIIASRHAHRIHVLSDGTIQYVLVTLNDRREEKILALGESSAIVAWYVQSDSLPGS